MKQIHKYNDFMVNESMKSSLSKFLNKILDIFHIEDKNELDRDNILNELTNLMNKYREDVLSNVQELDKKKILDIYENIKKQLDEQIISDFNLDSFFRGLSNLLTIKRNIKINIEEYFDSYIDNLPTRIDYIFGENIKDFTDDEEYKELKQIAKEKSIKLSKKQFKNEKIPLQIELLKMQEYIKKSGKRILILCDGRDAAGKGSAIKSITEYLQPKYFSVKWFDIPTKEEEDWFKRYYDVLPKPGNITFFDRSWYNRAINDPVMGYCTKEQYEQFMKDVVPFEEKLNGEGIQIIKLWFSISQEIQEIRFKLRQSSPLKYWKFSENDLKTISKWDLFTMYKEEMFRVTSTNKNPWIVVDSNDKRIAQLNVMRYILNEVDYDNKDIDNIGDPFPEIIIPMI